MATTIHDLARIAGVNASTISRALNGDKRVKAATIERIQALAQKHNYIPNRNARTLIVGRTGIVWLIMGSIESVIERTIAEYLTTALHKYDYDILIAPAGPDPTRWSSILERLRQRTADGAIIIPQANTIVGPIPDAPIVYLDRWLSHENIVVTSNNFLAVESLINNCLATGADEFFIHFPANNSVAEERLMSCQKILQGRAFTTDPTQLKSENWAIIAEDEHSALKMLQDCGVLKDNLIGGFFDSVDPLMAKYYLHRWVCIQDLKSMAECASELLVKAINGDKKISKMNRITHLEIFES